jgi:hypothetical protein
VPAAHAPLMLNILFWQAVAAVDHLITQAVVELVDI